MKILVTGGHVTPAIAVIEKIKERFPDWEIVFVGRKFAMEGEKDISAEYRVISDLGIRFLSLYTGRGTAVGSFVKMSLGFLQAYWYVLKERPAIIVSFGGYIALPVVIAGWLQRIASITHEQTRTIGRANYWISKVAKKVCVSFPDMVDKFPKEKTVYTSLPMRKALFQVPHKQLFTVSSKYPLIYIAGGATGSESINSLIISVLPELLTTYTIIHQTGYASYSSIQKKIEILPANLKNRYHVTPYLSVADLAWVYRTMQLYIGRSGANTAFELAALGKVAMFLPLPWAAGNEQQKNAEILERAGSAVIVSQKDASPEHLLKTIHKIFETLRMFERKAAEFSKTIPRDGASRMVSEIESLYQ